MFTPETSVEIARLHAAELRRAADEHRFRRAARAAARAQRSAAEPTTLPAALPVARPATGG